MHFRPIDFGMVGRRPFNQRIAIVAERSAGIRHALRFSAQFIDAGLRFRMEFRFHAKACRYGNVPTPFFAVGSQHIV